MMVFNVRPGGRADNTVGSGWLLGVGRRGDIALNYSGGEPVQDNRRLPNGNVLFSETGIGRIYEMTPGRRHRPPLVRRRKMAGQGAAGRRHPRRASPHPSRHQHAGQRQPASDVRRGPYFRRLAGQRDRPRRAARDRERGRRRDLRGDPRRRRSSTDGASWTCWTPTGCATAPGRATGGAAASPTPSIGAMPTPPPKIRGTAAFSSPSGPRTASSSSTGARANSCGFSASTTTGGRRGPKNCSSPSAMWAGSSISTTAR